MWMVVFLLRLLWEDSCRYATGLTGQSTARNLSHTTTVKPTLWLHLCVYWRKELRCVHFWVIEDLGVTDTHMTDHTNTLTHHSGNHIQLGPPTRSKVHCPCGPWCLQASAAVNGWNCPTSDWIGRTGLDGSLLKKKKKTWDANKKPHITIICP